VLDIQRRQLVTDGQPSLPSADDEYIDRLGHGSQLAARAAGQDAGR
jgi:hypothetical protein